MANNFTLARVNACTALLPEKKPRYVMGVVRGFRSDE